MGRSLVKHYRDMDTSKLVALLRKTKSDRATMRIRVTGADLSMYDAQIAECEKELARRSAKDGNSSRN